MFTDDGVEIEPFHLRNDIRDGLLTSDGFVKTSLRDFDRKQEMQSMGASDAWLDSQQVVDDQQKRLKEMQKKQHDSDASESEDEKDIVNQLPDGGKKKDEDS